jgi:2-polyprenyl-6-methoxyphenol hydroxylase-like FAD-dependent oxidoreductase
MVGVSRPIYRGYQAWRGVTQFVPTTHPPTTAVESWGHGKRFGFESIGRGGTFWYATVNAPQGTLGDLAGWKDEARVAFGGWVNPIPQLIESTDPGAILKHEIEDRAPVRPCGQGRITLLGDAAHLTTPNLGQGACMALEDALVLARSLAENGRDVADRLRRYESLRHGRTAFLTREARRIGRLGQLQNRWAVALRTFALRLTPSFLGEMRHRQYFSFET